MKVKMEEKFLQFADIEEVLKYKEKNNFDVFKVIGEYQEFIEVIFGRIIK